MLSGNGRHRRPRQAPALVVAAGVTGSALAIPLLGATSAHAVEGAVWDRLAECESGGVWSANMDNGYYGGLQLTQATWEQHGGLDYAPRPDLASRSQQIAVAEKILDELGPDAWPTCAPVSGIDEGEPNPIETLLPSEPTEPTDPAGTPDDPSATPSDDATATPSGDATPKQDDAENPDNTDNGGEGDNSEASPEPSPSEPTEPSGSTEPSEPSEGSGRHRGDPAPETPDSDRDGGSGRHADRGGSGRDGGNYTVRAGDSLWSIAESRDVDGGWAALYGANEEVVGDDPDLIVPGQVLDLGGK
ncbi:transglycosylase family protein [Streptomyces sp. NPDC002851]